MIGEHGEEAFRGHVAEVLDALVAVGPVSGPSDGTPPTPSPLDLALQEWNERGGITTPLDTCIGIRMLTIRDGVAYAQAGGGIVADSDPSAEYDETINKAKVLIRAIETAGRGL